MTKYKKIPSGYSAGRRNRLASLGLSALVLLTSTACWKSVAFREAAIPAVRQGLSQVLDGLLDGAIAAVDPVNTSASSETEDTTNQ